MNAQVVINNLASQIGQLSVQLAAANAQITELNDKLTAAKNNGGDQNEETETATTDGINPQS